MDKIALPKKIEFKNNGNVNEELVIIEPLFPGYGNTVGNSLRRVLLSSLPGSAVIGVKIKGVKHEFMALPGVKEDIVDIILNLKQLRLKILNDSDEVIKLELNAQGKKQVTAKDIKKNSQVEIINEDLVLATITDSTGILSMEISVSNGRGYALAERNSKETKEVDYIDIDSIFSPVLGVSYKVENVRVGKMTNWDKLVLDIKTDGTISVREAFEESVKILIDQFNSLIGLEKKEQKIEEESNDQEDEEVEEKEEKKEKKSPKEVKEKKVAKAKTKKVKE
ncbi:MAG: DNA-directed RNA polymerase subunit alpha [Patescibacteria group bacterium]|nr:DNA-directed RNA polymerase subunit alpha [Patescibacteria group bacterium]